jgi:acetylornithine/N-succinyldiaminopimelate aminotransferase
MTDALMGVYNRAPLAVSHGNGAWLHDVDGRAYLDCVAGIATDALGHAHPALIAALTEQAGKLWHVSNIFRIPGQEELAKRLTDASFADVVFFGNSGSEAIECALKTARRYHFVNGQPERIDIIGFAGSFHGRTYAAINAAGNPSYVEGFGPRLRGYVQLTIDDEAGIAEAIARPTTAALIVEPVQGEGGARALTGEWLKRVRDLCTAHGVLLIYDEVQSGMGRTGKLFAHQWFEGAEPDIMGIAKALGGGFPVGACLATSEAAKGMTVGVHGSTFGGNPLAMAVAIAAFDEIAKEDTLAHARAIADDLKTRLTDLAARYPDLIVDVRGKGLLIGLKMIPNNREFMALARDHGVLVAGGGENCVRLLPPLILSHEEAAEAVARIEAACEAARAQLAKAA